MHLAELKWPDVRDLSRSTPVVIPVAATEQHGHHMPLFTDSMLATEVVRRAHETLGDKILVAPLMWLGNSHHHMDFPGTVSADPRLYLDLLCGLADNFINHGFIRIVFINGHGGNDVPGRQAVFELRQRYRDRSDLLLLFGTYWLLGSEPHAFVADLQQEEMGHAGEWETSMMLSIAPQLVGNYQDCADVMPGNSFLPANRGWIMQDRSQPGHVGIPSAATVKKGDGLLACLAKDVTSMLDRVIAWDGSAWEG